MAKCKCWKTIAWSYSLPTFTFGSSITISTDRSILWLDCLRPNVCLYCYMV